jgi:hypothetical protein
VAGRGAAVPMMIKARAVTLVLIGSALAACTPIMDHAHRSDHETNVQKRVLSPMPSLPGPPPIKQLTSGPPEGGGPSKDDKWIDPPEVGR